VDGNQQARVVASHAGVSGSITALHRAWRYAASGTEMEIAPLGVTPMLIADTRRRFIDAFVEGQIAGAWRGGAGLTTGRQESANETRQQPSSRAWASYDSGSRGFDVALERSAGRLRGSGTAHVDRAVGDSDRISLSLTRLQLWRFGDFAWMDFSGSDSSSTTANDIRLDLTTRGIASMHPTWYVRAFSYSGVGANSVEGLAGGISATTLPSARLTARVRAEITQLVGDAGTGESSTPGGYVDAAVSARIAGAFRLALSGRYAPRTHWSGSVDDVPATRRIDFSINKALWQDRVRAQLVMRNLLNAAERSHPEGAQWNMRTHLAVTVALPSGASR
jgi:hypothetical protein